jgi:hypothetical protein
MTPEPPPIEQKVLRVFGHEQAYWTANGALIAFSLAQIGFGFAPSFIPQERLALRIVEVGVAITAAMALVGIILHMLNRTPWLSRWCYLLLCYSTGLTTLIFVVVGSRRLEFVGQAVVFLLLITGGLIALSMHVEHGGKRTVRRSPLDTP